MCGATGVAGRATRRYETRFERATFPLGGGSRYLQGPTSLASVFVPVVSVPSELSPW